MEFEFDEVFSGGSPKVRTLSEEDARKKSNSDINGEDEEEDFGSAERVEVDGEEIISSSPTKKNKVNNYKIFLSIDI